MRPSGTNPTACNQPYLLRVETIASHTFHLHGLADRRAGEDLLPRGPSRSCNILTPVIICSAPAASRVDNCAHGEDLAKRLVG